VVQPVKPQAPVQSARPNPAHSAKPAAAQPRPANDGAKASLSSDDVQRIYSNYVAARKQNAERVDNVKLDSIEKTIRGMLPGLEKKHAGKKIDFEVVVKDGKVALKPVAK
jgi:protein subunit release factor A